jgi:hypothetical protein
MPEYEVPSDNDVVAALNELGGTAPAVDLCRALVIAGHPVLQSQLAIQRAADRGRLQINKDWTLSVALEAVAA